MEELSDEDIYLVAMQAVQNVSNSGNEAARTRCDQIYQDLGVQNADCSEGKEQYKDMYKIWNNVTDGFGCMAAGGSIPDKKCKSGCLGWDGKCMS